MDLGELQADRDMHILSLRSLGKEQVGRKCYNNDDYAVGVRK